MTVTFEAIYENGVLVPTQPLKLAECERVSLTLETPVPIVPSSSGATAAVRRRAANRFPADPELAREVASGHVFDLLGE